jgi:bifunctional polynucleotide phosphatase/kinase
VNKSLIVGKYVTPSQGLEAPSTISTPRKVAAFDLDDTLITAAAGSKWAKSATGWKWWDVSVPAKLKNLHNDGYLVVILSNQGNISLKDNPKTLQKDAASLVNYKAQVTAVLRQLDLPISVYAATEPDGYRKPRVGMWQEMLEDYDLEREESIDLKQSFYVGDAAGRAKTDKRRKDHACSDR